jgi:hypothetical protein
VAALQPICCSFSTCHQHICCVDVSSCCVDLLLQAASPDEEALVAGAAYLGTKLLSR